MNRCIEKGIPCLALITYVDKLDSQPTHENVLTDYQVLMTLEKARKILPLPKNRIFPFINIQTETLNSYRDALTNYINRIIYEDSVSYVYNSNLIVDFVQNSNPSKVYDVVRFKNGDEYKTLTELNIRHALKGFKFVKNDGAELTYSDIGNMKLKEFLRLKNENERVFEIRVEPNPGFDEESQKTIKIDNEGP